MVTVCVPQISEDLQLTQGMELWYFDPFYNKLRDRVDS